MKIAFHAPMKPPSDPVPSGDRRMARLLFASLERAGGTPFIASTLRTRDGRGDRDAQTRLLAAAETETARLIDSLAAQPPALWFTYHCYYKAPDLIGPAVSRAFRIPYAIAEASRAKKRLTGPWSRFARAAEAAIDAASTVFAMTPQDRFALDRDRPAQQRIVDLPPFLEAMPPPVHRTAPRERPLRLLAVAMMRPGDKRASYEALAAALAHLTLDWHLTIVGDGPERPAVEAAFAPFGARIRFAGQVDDPAALHAHYAAADLFVWPGIGEAWGMVYLEAQATGLPAIAEDRPGPASVLAPGSRRVPQGEPPAFAAAIETLAAALPVDVRRHIEGRHDMDRAAAILAETLLIRQPA